MIQTVFLDLDDTIMDFRRAEAEALKRALQTMDVAPTEDVISRYSAINKAQWELLEQKKITRPQLLLRRFEILYHELGLVRSPAKTQEYYGEFLSRSHWLLPGAEELLKTLHGTYHLYLASNGTGPIQDRRIRDSGIGKYFHDIFISDYLGVNKPAKAFFDRCFARIPGFDLEKAIMVGDSLTSDMQGGIHAGLKTCWFNPGGKTTTLPIDYEIHDLSELPGLLEQI